MNGCDRRPHPTQEIQLSEDNSKTTYGNRKVIGSLLWKLLEQGASQGILFVVSVILARLLSPEEYGTISLITIFITIAGVFVQSGLSSALIQGKDITDDDCSSVLWTVVLISAALYLVLFLAAPAVAGFYEMPVLSGLLRLTALCLFPAGAVSVQSARLTRNMEFRRLFAATSIAVIISGGTAIAIAAAGYGPWAMGWQQVIYYLVLMFASYAVFPWRPRFRIVSGRLKPLFSFGWKLLAAGLLDAVWSSVYGLIIGKRWTASDLGGFTKGEQFPKLISANLSSAVSAVMLPVLSGLQDDRKALGEKAAESIELSAFIVSPLMFGLIAAAEPVTSAVLTDKWLFIVPYLRLFCLIYLLYPVNSVNLAVLTAAGRTDLFLILEICKKILGLAVLIISLKTTDSIVIMLLYKCGVEAADCVINALPVGRLTGYGPLRQLRDMIPSLLCSGVMCISVIMLNSALKGCASAWTALAVLIPAGAAVYTVMTLLFNKKMIRRLKDVIHRR